MSKRKVIIIASVAVALIVVVICYNLLTKVHNVNDLIDLDKVKRITIVSGANGECAEVTDEQMKRELINGLEKLELSRISNPYITGWWVSIILETESSQRKIAFIEDTCSDDKGRHYTVKHMDGNLESILYDILSDINGAATPANE